MLQSKNMKRLFAILATLGLLLTARADVETYTIDPVHSSTGFTLRHILSKFTSSFTKTTGTITVDRANLEKSSVEATVEIASVSTANEKRDNHIKSADFLDVAKFPQASFKSTSIKKTPSCARRRARAGASSSATARPCARSTR